MKVKKKTLESRWQVFLDPRPGITEFCVALVAVRLFVLGLTTPGGHPVVFVCLSVCVSVCLFTLHSAGTPTLLTNVACCSPRRHVSTCTVVASAVLLQPVLYEPASDYPVHTPIDQCFGAKNPPVIIGVLSQLLASRACFSRLLLDSCIAVMLVAQRSSHRGLTQPLEDKHWCRIALSLRVSYTTGRTPKDTKKWQYST
eukprot:2626938-Amphidinium_carterae.1